MPRILIVEDNEMNLDMLSRRLSRQGFEIAAATDGAQAVALAASAAPDLLLMDMSLPVMDGWTATRAIKSDSSIAHIPVMALTAHAIVGDREKAFGAGCDEYDTKPVEWARLQEKIAALLAGQRGTAERSG